MTGITRKFGIELEISNISMGKSYEAIKAIGVKVDGYEFTADTKRDACDAIWHSMLFQMHDTLGEWMTANAKTMHGALGKTPRTDSPENHFDDMVEHGILVILDA